MKKVKIEWYAVIAISMCVAAWVGAILISMDLGIL